MGRRNAFGLAFLAASAGLGCVFLGEARIEELVESAATADDHWAIVEYYREKAAEARKKGAEHRRLAGVYGGRHNWGVAFADRAGGHYELAALEDERAARYELLAVEHERVAQE